MMAINPRRTQSQRIEELQKQRILIVDALDNSNPVIKQIKGQGTDAASTEFNDPTLLRRELDLIDGKLEMEWSIY